MNNNENEGRIKALVQKVKDAIDKIMVRFILFHWTTIHQESPKLASLLDISRGVQDVSHGVQDILHGVQNISQGVEKVARGVQVSNK